MGEPMPCCMPWLCDGLIVPMLHWSFLVHTLGSTAVPLVSLCGPPVEDCRTSCASPECQGYTGLFLAQRQDCFCGAGRNGRPIHDGTEGIKGGAVSVEARTIGMGIDGPAQETRRQEKLAIAAILGGLH